MGLFASNIEKMYKRGDFRGLVGALGMDPQSSVEATLCLTLSGELALPFLLPEIPRTDGKPFGTEEFLYRETGAARLAVAGMCGVAIPYMFEAILEGDANMAWGAANVFARMEVGGWYVLREKLPPMTIDYPDEVRAAYEHKVGMCFRPVDTLTQMQRHMLEKGVPPI